MHPARLHAHQGAALRGGSDAPGQPSRTVGHSRRESRLRFQKGDGAEKRAHQGFCRLSRQAAQRTESSNSSAPMRKFVDAAHGGIDIPSPGLRPPSPRKAGRDRARRTRETSQRNISSSPPARPWRRRRCRNSTRSAIITSDDALALEAAAEVAHRSRRRRGRVRVRAILRALRRQGHAHPAQRTHFEGIRHRRGGGNRKGFPARRHPGFHRHKAVGREAKGKIENGFVRARRQNGFCFRRGNFVRAGPGAEHRRRWIWKRPV